MIDAATQDHPVLVHRLDCHMALANSVALQMAGLTRSTPDVPGGVIVRDPASGEPTGLLKDAAENLVTRMIPAKTAAQKRAAARRATDYAASLGVTSVTDVSAEEDVALYHQMAAAGELKTRIYGARSIISWEVAAHAGLCAGFGSTMVRTGLLKGFADGSLGSFTALFLEPYADAPGNSGLYFEQMLPAGTMLERAVKGDAAGLQLAIHAIGDRANREILALFEEVARRNGRRDRRARIEHAQHLRREDIERFAQLGVIVSMQPAHAADDGRWCEKCLGKARCETAYALRSLLDSGDILAFGSDWTVASLDPLTGIKAAVTRETLDGGHPGGWIPGEKITLQEAIYGYTMGSAYAESSEREKGSITPGKLADLIVMDRSLFDLRPVELDQAKVRITMLGGKVVFEA